MPSPRSLGQNPTIRFVPIVFAHFAGFKGEYWAVFNRKTREIGGNRQCSQDYSQDTFP